MKQIIDYYNLPFTRVVEARSLYCSMTELDRYYAKGDITKLQYRWRKLFWEFAVTHHTSRLQDKCYAAHGQKGIVRRIKKINAIRVSYIQKYFSEFLIFD